MGEERKRAGPELWFIGDVGGSYEAADSPGVLGDSGVHGGRGRPLRTLDQVCKFVETQHLRSFSP